MFLLRTVRIILWCIPSVIEDTYKETKKLNRPSPINTSTFVYMDYKEPSGNRRKKSDKGKEKYERNGGISQRHIRISSAVQGCVTKKITSATTTTTATK